MRAETETRHFFHQLKRGGMSLSAGMEEREPHSIAQTRGYIRQATAVFASIEIEFERDDEQDADSVSVQITKKQAREIISITMTKGDQIVCHFDEHTRTLRIT